MSTPAATSPSTAASLGGRNQSPVQKLQHLLHAHPALSPALILVLTFIVFSMLNGRFASAASLSLMIQQTAVIACLAVGQTLIILTAGIDLSVGAIAILSTMFSATIAYENGLPGFLAVMIGLAVGTLCGALNGFLVTRVNLPPFIVTLGTLSIFTAIALLYSGGQSIQGTDLPEFLNFTGKTISLGGFTVTYGVIIVALVYLAVGFALSQTAWGRHVYAVGDDAEAARLSGIAAKKVLLSVYAAAGFITASRHGC